MVKREVKLERSKKSRSGLTLEEKEAIIRDLIGIDKDGNPVYGIDKDGKRAQKYAGLKINRENLKMLLDKYGGQAYDILQMANLNPQRLMHTAVVRHEAEYAENPIVQEYLADKKSITPDKALEFFATEPISKELVAELCLVKDIQMYGYLASNRIKRGGGTSTHPNQEKLNKRVEGRRAAQADKQAKEQKAKRTNLGVRQAGGAEIE